MVSLLRQNVLNCAASSISLSLLAIVGLATKARPPILVGMSDQWEKGQQSALAELAGLSQSYVSEIIHGKKRAGPDAARHLAAACAELDIPLTVMDFLYPDESLSPLLTR
jgi:transcriptional regulator with XRE-family HTH domain